MWPPISSAVSEFALQRRPQVAGGVLVDLDGQLGELLAQPRPRRDPGIREGDALRAVGVAGQRA